MAKAMNQDIMKNENILSVLRCIVEYAPVSKKRIQNITGLSWGSVSAMSSELIKTGIIEEKIHSNSTALGRNPVDLIVCTDRNQTIGLDINIEGISVILMDLTCSVHFSTKEKLKNIDKESILIQSFKMVDSILKTGREKINGIGIAMQGAVDSLNGVAIYSPYFDDWVDIPIKKIFEDRYNLPVFIDHRPNCMALSEIWSGVAKGVKNLLFIGLSDSIGMSIIINDVIYRGADGNAGEFGHITMKPNGRKCRCGNYGCLETIASCKSLIEMAYDGSKSYKGTAISEIIGDKTIEEIDIDSLYRAVNMDDKLCINLFDEMSTYLGIAISNIINLFNPELIVIGGILAQYESLFANNLKEVVENRTWKYSRKNILFSKSPSNTASIGAALLVVRNVINGEIGLVIGKS